MKSANREPSLPYADPSGGFTIVELLVTIAIAGILMMVAAPSFTQFAQNGRMTSQLNSLVSSLNYARSEAVKQDNNVTICASSDGSTCSASGDWSQGWVMYYCCDSSSANIVVQSIPSLSGGNTLSATDNAASAAAPKIEFLANSKLKGSPSPQISFLLCDKRGGAYARDVELNSLGRVQTVSKAGLSPSGSALSCP